MLNVVLVVSRFSHLVNQRVSHHVKLVNDIVYDFSNKNYEAQKHVVNDYYTIEEFHFIAWSFDVEI